MGRWPSILAVVVLVGAVAPSGRAQEPEITIEAEPADQATTPPNETSGSADRTAESPESLHATVDSLRTTIETLQSTIGRLEARLAEVEARATTGPEPAAVDPSPELLGLPPVTPTAAPTHWWEALDLRFTGYLQSQLVFSQYSSSELTPEGTPLNQDRFLIRRGRLRVDRNFRYANLAFEVDASTTAGPFVGVRRAETSFFYPSSRDGAPPLVMVTVGLTDVPFGFEVRENPRTRWFLERSAGSLAFQRGEPDIGVRVSGGIGVFRYAFAVMNGNPLSDRPGGEPIDLTRAKDLIGRVGVEDSRNERFQFRAGVSFESGTGLHPGTPATKPTVIWRDTNEDGLVQTFELTGVPARAATPSIEFHRWALNADAGVGFRTRIGWSQVYGEVTMASNLDRSMYVADPIATGYDLREVAWYVALLQEITDYAIVGFRVDYYNPDSDFLENRRGVSVPVPTSQITFSPMVGATLRGLGRLVMQYDRIRDHLGRTSTGDATDLRNDQFVVRLQTEF